jgi:voltage-gated potassium channel
MNGGSMWQQSKNGRVVHPFEPAILVATLALIPVLIIERDVSSGAWVTVAKVANWAIWAIFAAELIFILVVAPRKRAALRAHWLDVAIVLVTVPLYGELLSSIRAVRLFRLLRLLRASVVVTRAIQAERRLTSGNALRLASLATLFLTVMAGAVQSTVDTRDFASFWDGVWWAVVTVTTVGYGDLYPHTVAGRIIAMAVMLLGIGFLAVLTATVASHFVQIDQQTEGAEVLDTLRRIEADVAALKAQLAARH